jgi:uncharacterized membrane protein
MTFKETDHPKIVAVNQVRVHSTGIWKMLLGAAGLIFVVAIIVAVFVDTTAGLLVAAVGGVFTVGNPIVWVSILRAKERQAEEQDQAAHEPVLDEETHEPREVLEVRER